MEEIKELIEFLGHIQPKIGESAFDSIWNTVEELNSKIQKLNKSLDDSEKMHSYEIATETVRAILSEPTT